MKTMLLLLMFFSAVILRAIDLDKPIDKLELPDGRILTHAQFTAFRSLDVVIKHAGGSILLRYEFLPEDVRAAAELKRPGGPQKHNDVRSNTKEQTLAPTKIGGQAFAAGLDQPYIFAGMHLQLLDSNRELIADGMTDTSGRFSILPAKGGACFLRASAAREYRNGTKAIYKWDIDLAGEKDLSGIVLTGENAKIDARVPGTIGTHFDN